MTSLLADVFTVPHYHCVRVHSCMYEKHLLKLEMQPARLACVRPRMPSVGLLKHFFLKKTVHQLAVRLWRPNTSHVAHSLDCMRLRGVATYCGVRETDTHHRTS